MLELRDVSLRFGPLSVLDQVSFVLRPGERVGIVGASGTGKSSLLKMAAGLLATSSGACINSYRHPLLVFQEPRLLPWRRIHQNIEIPLLAAGLAKQEAQARARHWLARVGLASSSRAWPHELSGGMAQRAALARAFALQPDLLLLDEPFSALDPALRADLGKLCVECVADTGAAMLCISHHPHELVDMVDRCIVIADRKITPFALEAAASGRQAAPLPHRALLNQEPPTS
ncbi:ATP-binding cassette domain-containing protein [Pusillimonas sp. SM2304]|uniref:ATP-binding cassette domain-containing protein n=1 Tax=Pusillimonas sp. SM2304 TaxID=3073241 RepID=UPI0028761533|nr:ATP-binding cassette domain-containing protein [Pusillimonas sp. SM2304]MDS1139143.1 ATP-binding cassette domain-containing protein [Pusillimonas sp. SM2304]